MKKRQWTLALLMAGMLWAVMSEHTTRAGAADEIVIRAATIAPEGTPWEKQLKAFKKYVEKASGDRIKVKMFMGGSLGGEKGLVRRTAQGTLEVFGGSTGAMGSLVPELNVIEAPYLFEDDDHADKVLDGPALPIVKKVLDKKGFTFGLWAENGFRSWFTKDRPIKQPSDLKGLRMRSQESPVHLATYKAFSATPVPIDITNVLTSLQTGVVDGFDNTPLYAFAASWYQVAKHATLSRHCYQPGIVAMSKRWFTGLPPDIQKILSEIPASVTEQGRQDVRAMDPILIKNLERYGIQVHRPSASERAAFKKVASGVATSYANKTGKDAKALLKAIRSGG